MERKSRQGPTGELGPHMGQWEPLFPSVNHVDPSSSEAEKSGSLWAKRKWLCSSSLCSFPSQASTSSRATRIYTYSGWLMGSFPGSYNLSPRPEGSSFSCVVWLPVRGKAWKEQPVARMAGLRRSRSLAGRSWLHLVCGSPSPVPGHPLHRQPALGENQAGYWMMAHPFAAWAWVWGRRWLNTPVGAGGLSFCGI